MTARPLSSALRWAWPAGLATALAVTAIACGDSSSGSPTSATPSAPGAPAVPSSPVADAPPAASGRANLSIRLTDGPFQDAAAVLITFSEVSVHNATTGEWLTIPFVGASSRTCDLKKLEGPVDLLGVGALPPATYTQIRLHVSEASLYFDNPAAGPACAPAIAAPAGESAPMMIPSGEVKLNHPFTLAAGGTTVTLDFDGDKSIHATGSGNAGGGNGGGNGRGNGRGNGGSEKPSNTKYMMKPVIRVVSVQ